jgi:large subunit ribosomal protein L30
MGMVRKIKDYIAYGPVDENTIFKLLSKRGKKGKNKLTLKEADMKKAAKDIFGGKKTVEYANPVFKLRPPSKGYKNIKKNYPEGDLGKREEMNSLLARMM